MRSFARLPTFRRSCVQVLQTFTLSGVRGKPGFSLHRQHAVFNRAATLWARPKKKNVVPSEIQLQRLRSLNDSLIMTTVLTDRPEETVRPLTIFHVHYE